MSKYHGNITVYLAGSSLKVDLIENNNYSRNYLAKITVQQGTLDWQNCRLSTLTPLGGSPMQTVKDWLFHTHLWMYRYSMNVWTFFPRSCRLLWSGDVTDPPPPSPWTSYEGIMVGIFCPSWILVSTKLIFVRVDSVLWGVKNSENLLKPLFPRKNKLVKKLFLPTDRLFAMSLETNFLYAECWMKRIITTEWIRGVCCSHVPVFREVERR